DVLDDGDVAPERVCDGGHPLSVAYRDQRTRDRISFARAPNCSSSTTFSAYCCASALCDRLYQATAVSNHDVAICRRPFAMYCSRRGAFPPLRPGGSSGAYVEARFLAVFC